ncbi:MAG: hypothetical protein IJJ69_08675 [Oscillospiraceae bacterium]|nr:hypothetical protein [Oscillospiraceae bacterium]
MADTQIESEVIEFRGCDSLVIAEVTADNSAAYTFGTVKELAPVATISKNVETSTTKKYYDNVAKITIRSEGADEVALTVPALPLAMLAWIIGKEVDNETGAFMDTPAVERKFAIGYRIKLTDGTYRYVWRLKGTFSIPDEETNTEDDGTDSNNQQLTFSGDRTIHKFTKTGTGVKAVVLDERDDKCNFDTFFDTVQTPDTIASLKKTA